MVEKLLKPGQINKPIERPTTYCFSKINTFRSYRAAVMKQYENETAASKKAQIQEVFSQSHQPQKESDKAYLAKWKKHYENQIILTRKEIEMLQKQPQKMAFKR